MRLRVDKVVSNLKHLNFRPAVQIPEPKEKEKEVRRNSESSCDSFELPGMSKLLKLNVHCALIATFNCLPCCINSWDLNYRHVCNFCHIIVSIIQMAFEKLTFL